MKISNIRLGLATNSSSSHSIVILPEPMYEGGMVDLPDYEGETIKKVFGGF